MRENSRRISKRFRRAKSLLSYWRDGHFVIENYLLGTQIRCHPLLLTWLHSLDSEYAHELLLEDAARRGIPGHVVRELVSAGIFLSAGSANAARDDAVSRWPWSHDARYFHFATQEVAFTFDHEAIRAHFEKKAISDPPPSPFKEYPEEPYLLPAAVTPGANFFEVLTARRTCRDFANQPLSLIQLSALLKWTFGMVRYYNDSRLDRRIIRTSPSGGARHPIEAYLVVRRVKGLTGGIYHYSVEKHGLTLIKKGRPSRLASRLFCGQQWVQTASVALFLTAMLPRSMWKYDHSRAYRVVLLDAGHIGQTFHLVATALGLGVFTTAAIADREIEKELGIDGVNEVVVYGGAVGLKAGGLRAPVRDT